MKGSNAEKMHLVTGIILQMYFRVTPYKVQMTSLHQYKQYKIKL